MKIKHGAKIVPIIKCADRNRCEVSEICKEEGYRYMACNFFSEGGYCNNPRVVEQIKNDAMFSAMFNGVYQ